MSTQSASQPRHFRASSTQHGTSSHSKFSSNDEFFNENMSYIKRYLSKYDEVPERNNFLSKLQQEDRTSSALKNVNENSYAEFDQKYKGQADEHNAKAEMSKRVANLEHKVQELTQKLARDGSRGPETRQEDTAKVNDRFMCIEQRVDMMDRKLDKLSSVLEAFMQRFQGYITSSEMLGSGTQDDSRASVEQVHMRREILHETADRLPEIKLLENNFVRDSDVEKAVVEPKIFTTPTVHRRAPSKDAFEVRDRVRESLEQSGRKRDEKMLQAKQSSFRDRVDMVEPKILIVDQPERNKLMMRPQEKTLDRLETRESMDTKALNKLKGSLRSPDTARKRKNVSWSENNWVSDGNIHVEAESGQKRKRMDTSESNDYERYNEIKYEMKKDESDTTKRAREIIEEKYKQVEMKAQRGSSLTREEDNTYEKQTKYMAGDSRTEKIKSEVEKLEEKLRKIEANGNGSQNATEKERQLEEKRRKIDEEIQRRLSRHSDIKKRGDSIDAGQKRMPHFENDLKGRSCDNDALYDKDIMSRSDLISKYSDLLQSSSKKSKNI